MKKNLLFYMVLLMCIAQPAEASRWRYILPSLARSVRHINDQPNVSYLSNSEMDSDNPWNYIMPCILLAGGIYLLWPLFKEEEIRSTSTLTHRNHQSSPTSFTQHEIILANGGGILLR